MLFRSVATQVETNFTGWTWLESLQTALPSHNIVGGKTTDATRPGLVTLLILALERGHYSVPKDSIIGKELLSFVLNKNGRPEAAKGATDDTLFASMHCLSAAGYNSQGVATPDTISTDELRDWF